MQIQDIKIYDTETQFELLTFQKIACTAGRWTYGISGISEQHVPGIQGGYRLGFSSQAGDMYCPSEMPLCALRQ